jgi:glycosyltransferase 2 family protein
MSRDLLNRALRSWAFRLAATLILLGIIVWRSQPRQLGSSFSKLGLENVLLAAVLTLPFLGFKSLRWLYMLRFAGSEATFGEAAMSLVGGMGIALLTPARVGEVARIAYLKDPRKLRLSGLVILDKFFDVLVLALLAIPGAWQILGWPAGAALCFVGAAGLLFVFFPSRFQGPIGVMERRAPLGGRTHEVFSSLESLSPLATLLYIGLTVAAFALVIIQFGLILRGNPHLSPTVALLTFPLVILTNIVPITIAGLGIREGAAILLLGHYHVRPALAAVSAFTMFFLNTALPGIVGAFMPLLRRRTGRVDRVQQVSE